MMKFFNREPSEAELTERLDRANARYMEISAQLEEVGVDALYDDAAAIKAAVLRDEANKIDGEIEILGSGLEALRKRRISAENARLAFERKAKAEAWQRAADEALRELAEGASGFDAAISDAGAYLQRSRNAARVLAHLAGDPANEQGLKFISEQLVHRDALVYRAIRKGMGIQQPTGALRSSDSTLFDALCSQQATEDSEAGSDQDEQLFVGMEV